MTDDHFWHIYKHAAPNYDALVRCEDYQGNLLRTFRRLHSLDGATVVEFGAGTGRLTRLLAPYVHKIHAFDLSRAMLDVAYESLYQSGLTNWSIALGDNCAVPVANNVADIVIEGWSFGHLVGWYPDTWTDECARALAEMRRIARPGGLAILIETLGTGTTEPAPPTEGLAELFNWWEEVYGFQRQVIRTDYHFDSLSEAEQLTRFFFGDELAERVAREELLILPECTGIWWKHWD
ncbi:MAG: class I SAM-dependent methyltransferase [Chloroflexi bacterium]|nr:MAG: class I SAM-dependent methyltransferase [Chloroflexota bacterium]